MTMDSSHYFGQPSTAEDILVNLGFSGNGSFLPERFAKDWYNKIMHARMERIQQLQQAEIADMLECLQPSGEMTPQSVRSSGRSTPLRHSNSSSELLHKLDMQGRHKTRLKGSQLQRAATILTYHEDQLNDMQVAPGQWKKRSPSVDSTTLDHIPEGDASQAATKQDSIDELKYVLERQAQIFHLGGEKKRTQFASSRQKSLPLFLETLSEEEEGRMSRGPSIDHGHRGSQLKTFLEEEEASQSSGGSNVKQSISAQSRTGSITSASSLECPLIISTPCESLESSTASPKVMTRTSSKESFHSTTSELPPEAGRVEAAAALTLPESLAAAKKRLDLAYLEQRNSSAATTETTSSLSTNDKSNGENTTNSGSGIGIVPSILVNSQGLLMTQSSCSLEVADILAPSLRGGAANRARLNGGLKSTSDMAAVEPALLSVTLSDVIDTRRKRNTLRLPTEEKSRSSLSPTSSLSVSPIPASPVTVIELSELDNQDILDIEECSDHSRRTSQTSCMETVIEMAPSLADTETLIDGSGEWDDDIEVRESEAEARDGWLSPLCTYLHISQFTNRRQRRPSDISPVPKDIRVKTEGDNNEQYGKNSNLPAYYQNIGSMNYSFVLNELEKTFNAEICVVTDVGVQCDLSTAAASETVKEQDIKAADLENGNTEDITIEAVNIPEAVITSDIDCQTDTSPWQQLQGDVMPWNQPLIESVGLCDSCKVSIKNRMSINQNFKQGLDVPQWRELQDNRTIDRDISAYHTQSKKALDKTIERLVQKTRRCRQEFGYKSISELLATRTLESELEQLLETAAGGGGGGGTGAGSVRSQTEAETGEDSKSPAPSTISHTSREAVDNQFHQSRKVAVVNSEHHFAKSAESHACPKVIDNGSNFVFADSKVWSQENLKLPSTTISGLPLEEGRSVSSQLSAWIMTGGESVMSEVSSLGTSLRNAGRSDVDSIVSSDMKASSSVASRQLSEDSLEFSVYSKMEGLTSAPSLTVSGNVSPLISECISEAEIPASTNINNLDFFGFSTIKNDTHSNYSDSLSSICGSKTDVEDSLRLSSDGSPLVSDFDYNGHELSPLASVDEDVNEPDFSGFSTTLKNHCTSSWSTMSSEIDSSSNSLGPNANTEAPSATKYLQDKLLKVELEGLPTSIPLENSRNVNYGFLSPKGSFLANVSDATHPLFSGKDQAGYAIKDMPNVFDLGTYPEVSKISTEKVNNCDQMQTVAENKGEVAVLGSAEITFKGSNTTKYVTAMNLYIHERRTPDMSESSTTSCEESTGKGSKLVQKEHRYYTSKLNHSIPKNSMSFIPKPPQLPADISDATNGNAVHNIPENKSKSTLRSSEFIWIDPDVTSRPQLLTGDTDSVKEDVQKDLPRFSEEVKHPLRNQRSRKIFKNVDISTQKHAKDARALNTEQISMQSATTKGQEPFSSTSLSALSLGPLSQDMGRSEQPLQSLEGAAVERIASRAVSIDSLQSNASKKSLLRQTSIDIPTTSSSSEDTSNQPRLSTDTFFTESDADDTFDLDTYVPLQDPESSDSEVQRILANMTLLPKRGRHPNLQNLYAAQGKSAKNEQSGNMSGEVGQDRASCTGIASAVSEIRKAKRNVSAACRESDAVGKTGGSSGHQRLSSSGSVELDALSSTIATNLFQLGMQNTKNTAQIMKEIAADYSFMNIMDNAADNDKAGSTQLPPHLDRELEDITTFLDQLSEHSGAISPFEDTNDDLTDPFADYSLISSSIDNDNTAGRLHSEFDLSNHEPQFQDYAAKLSEVAQAMVDEIDELLAAGENKPHEFHRTRIISQ